MAGKRQHFIPRFLQQGFTSRATNNGEFTWVFRSDAVPFETNTRNIGVESRFYTNDDDEQADVLITEVENEFSILIDHLRAGKKSYLSDPKLPQFIAHLEIRTRHLRKNLLNSTDIIISSLLDFLSDGENFSEWLKRKLLSDPSLLRQTCAESIAERGLPQELSEPTLKLATLLAPVFIDQQKSEFSTLATMLRPILQKQLKQSAKSGHIRALKQSPIPEPKVKFYEDLTYSILSDTKEPLILGDSVVLFQVDGPRSYKSFLEADDVLNAVYLPIDSGKMLVGSLRGFTDTQSSLTKEIARCSMEYFIATENSRTNRQLQKSINTNAALFSQTELNAVIEEALQL